MGQKELLLTLGAIALFSMISFRVNQAAVRNSEAIYTQQAEFFALSLAQRFIEEAKTKAFDEFVIAATPSDSTAFTPSPMGTSTETYPDFDDVDDFRVYETDVDTKMGTMSLDFAVHYVQDTDLYTAVVPQTYYKKMTVTVRSDYLLQPVRAEYVFAFQKNL